MSMSTDGKQCASAAEDRRVRVWDLAQGTQVTELRGVVGDVTSVVWCQDSRHLVTCSGEGEVRVWDTMTPGDSVTEAVAVYSCGVNTRVVGANFTDTNTLLVTAVETL